MEQKEKYVLDTVNAYANEVMGNIDPQKTRVSLQLEKLQPIMEKLAEELQTTPEDIFILYMDAASTVSVDNERKFQSELGNMTSYGDMHFDSQNNL